jgi:hypothetical protein
MRTGTIKEVIISKETEKINANFSQKKNDKTWIKNLDSEQPKSVGIDMVSMRIFTLTSKGLFSCWDLVTFEIIYTKNFYKKSKYLRSLRLSNKVMLVFDTSIAVLDTDERRFNQKKPPAFDELAEYVLNLNTITYAMLAHNEKLLGVATTSASTPEVTLYSTEGGFNKLK